MSNTRTFLFLSLLVSQFISFVGYGQAARRPDEIVRKDNTIIEGLISEINETAIYYRKPTAPQGQQYQVKKADVRYIKYSNNEVESFEEKAPQKAGTARSAGTSTTSRTRPEPARNVPSPSRAAAPAASSSDPHADSASPLVLAVVCGSQRQRVLIWDWLSGAVLLLKFHSAAV